MIRNILLSSLLFTGVVACGDDANNTTPDAAATPDTPNGGSVVRVNDNITSSVTWEAKNVYVLPRLKQV